MKQRPRKELAGAHGKAMLMLCDSSEEIKKLEKRLDNEMKARFREKPRFSFNIFGRKVIWESKYCTIYK